MFKTSFPYYKEKFVTPAEAGVQAKNYLDFCFHENDEPWVQLCQFHFTNHI